MTVTVTKSVSITALDAVPPTNGAVTAGEGAPGYAKVVLDTATPTVLTGTGTSGQVVKFIRLPMTAKLKSYRVESAAQTKGTWDWGFYYSDSTIDGTLPSLQGTAILTSVLIHGLSFASAVLPTDETNQSGNWSIAKRNEPLWIALAIPTANVSGYVDICATNSAATVSVAGAMGLQVEFNT